MKIIPSEYTETSCDFIEKHIAHTENDYVSILNLFRAVLQILNFPYSKMTLFRREANYSEILIKMLLNNTTAATAHLYCKFPRIERARNFVNRYFVTIFIFTLFKTYISFVVSISFKHLVFALQWF